MIGGNKARPGNPDPMSFVQIPFSFVQKDLCAFYPAAAFACTRHIFMERYRFLVPTDLLHQHGDRITKVQVECLFGLKLSHKGRIE